MNAIDTSRPCGARGWLLVALLLSLCPRAQAQESIAPLRVHTVNGKVADLPANDFTTPERAAAAITRLMIDGGSDAEWARADFRHRGGGAAKLSPEKAETYRAGIVREVHVYKGRIALVTVEVTQASRHPAFER